MKVSEISSVKLDVRRLGVRLARADILEQVLPIWSLHGAPLPILVLLPCHIKECWRREAGKKANTKRHEPNLGSQISWCLNMLDSQSIICKVRNA